VKYLVSLGFADEKRIGIHGWSYGGFMTLNALLNAPEVFRLRDFGSAGDQLDELRHHLHRTLHGVAEGKRGRVQEQARCRRKPRI